MLKSSPAKTSLGDITRAAKAKEFCGKDISGRYISLELPMLKGSPAKTSLGKIEAE